MPGAAACKALEIVAPIINDPVVDRRSCDKQHWMKRSMQRDGVTFHA